MIEIDLSIASAGWKALGDVEAVEALAREVVEAALAVAGEAQEELSLSLLFAGDEAVRALNRGFRGKDKPTNVLSFPAPVPPGLPGSRPLGDVVLAFETVAWEAENEGKTLADHARHLIVHGTLHLLGYDHETDAEAERMEALEVKALARLGIADPYREAAA